MLASYVRLQVAVTVTFFALAANEPIKIEIKNPN